MTAVPHTELAPFYLGFPAIITTIPVFEVGGPLDSLAGATLIARAASGAELAVATISVTGRWVRITFAAGDLAVGKWTGQLASQYDVMATFEFEVLAVV